MKKFTKIMMGVFFLSGYIYYRFFYNEFGLMTNFVSLFFGFMIYPILEYVEEYVESIKIKKQGYLS